MRRHPLAFYKVAKLRDNAPLTMTVQSCSLTDLFMVLLEEMCKIIA